MTLVRKSIGTRGRLLGHVGDPLSLHLLYKGSAVNVEVLGGLFLDAVHHAERVYYEVFLKIVHRLVEVEPIRPPALFDQYAKLSFWYNTASSRCNVLMVRP